MTRKLFDVFFFVFYVLHCPSTFFSPSLLWHILVSTNICSKCTSHHQASATCTCVHDMLLLGGIYRSPSKDITTSTKDLCALLKIVTDTNPSHLIILGDFNYPEINWNYTISRAAENHPSNMFLNSIQDSLLYQHVTQPTRHRLGESPNTLDLVLTNEEGMINKIIPLPPIGNSDHICLNVFTSMSQRNPRHPNQG